MAVGNGARALRRAGEAWLQGRLSVLHKLVLLIVAMTAPLAVASAIYWAGTQEAADAGRRELRALGQFEAIWPVLVEAARGEAPSAATLRGWRNAEPHIAADGAATDSFEQALAAADRAAILGEGFSLLNDISNRSGLMTTNGPAPTWFVWLTAVRLPSLLDGANALSGAAHQEPATRWRAAGQFNAVAQYTIGSTRGAVAQAGALREEARGHAARLISAAERVSALAFAHASQPDEAAAAELAAAKGAMIGAADAMWTFSMRATYTRIEAELAALSADRRATLACWLAALALISILAVALARSIAHPQYRLAEVISNLADGKTDAAAPYQAHRNEIGAMARAIEVVRLALIERKHLENDLDSERRALERRVAERTAELEAANSAKTNFVASLAHEIRTPLNGVLGMAAALERTPLDARQAGMVKIINSSGDVLLKLLANAIDIARIESGKAELDIAPFDLPELVDNAAALYREAATAKGVALHVAVSPEAEGVFCGDGLRIRQVLQNLISNAVKFTEKGSVSISVSAAPAPGGRMAITFEVADTGIGLPTQSAPLFERFSQADRTGSRRFGGTGLGLSICKQLAALMAGSISGGNRTGGGAVFRFVAPLERETLAAPTAATPLELPPSGLRALAADDNPVNLIVLRTLLAQLGINADFAHTGRDALDAALSLPYDIIFLDVNMPIMDGLAVTRTLRATDGPNRRTPILALSADAMPEQVARHLAAGMTAQVSKPIQVDLLAKAISEALSAFRRQHREAAQSLG